MLIAVASKSGTAVDQHFGHAERFLIYDYAKGHPRLVREVGVQKYCHFDLENPMRTDRFDAIAEALRECRALVTAMIGDHPRQMLESLGFKVVSIEAPIEEALHQVHKLVCSGKCRAGSCSG